MKHPKSVRALDKFAAYLKKADVSKLNEDMQALLKDFQGDLLPAFQKGKVTKGEAAADMAHAHECMKLKPGDKKNLDMVIQSLKKDKSSHTKPHLAQRMHKRLLKCKADAKAQEFWNAAQALYPESGYFNSKPEEEEEETNADSEEEKQ